MDAEGYEPPAAPPETVVVAGDPRGAAEEIVHRPGEWTAVFAKLPVEVINLETRTIVGSIGTFDLTEEQDFIRLAQRAMRRAIDALCDAPESPTTATKAAAPTKPLETASSAPSTAKKRGTKRGRPTKKGGAAQQPELPVS
jgi:hypothetical protein